MASRLCKHEVRNMFPLKGLAPLGARPFFMKLCCREGDTNWRNEMRGGIGNAPVSQGGHWTSNSAG